MNEPEVIVPGIFFVARGFLKDPDKICSDIMDETDNTLGRSPTRSRDDMTIFIRMEVPLHPNMTFEEIETYYKNHDWKHFANAKVWRRSELDNADPSVKRGANCMCGSCWDDKLCACGRDRVAHGRRCFTCGRPSWCER